MPWKNHSGGPWGGGDGGDGGGGGRGGGGPTPPNIDELLRRSQERVRSVLPGGMFSARGLTIIAAIVVGVWLASGFYRVQPGEAGVELIFGKYTVTTGPGLNFNWPSPIGSVEIPDVQRQRTTSIGFRRDSGVDRNIPGESLMLTGDQNIIDLSFTVLWNIKDPERYVFRVREQELTVKRVAESVMREVIGQTELQSALKESKTEIELAAQDQLQTLLDDYGTGIRILKVELQRVDPPSAVISAYRDYEAARQDRQRLQEEAQAYANDVVPRAEGQAARIGEEAEAYRNQVQESATGESQRFLQVLAAYDLAQDVTRQRIYLETIAAVFADMPKIILDTGAGAGDVIPYLPLTEIQNRLTTGAGGGQ